MQPKDKQQGLTLVEVVVVVAVIGIVVLPILSMFVVGIQSVHDSRLLLTAALIAQEKVEEVLSVPPANRTYSMDVIDARITVSGRNFDFTRRIEDTSPPDPGLRQVTVEVEWQGSRAAQSYKVVTYVEGP